MTGSCNGTIEIVAPTLDADITLSLLDNIIHYGISIGNPNNYNVYPVIMTFTIDGLDCGPACGNLFGPQAFGANSPLTSFGNGSFNSSQYGGPGDHTICLILNIMGQDKQPVCKTITVPTPIVPPIIRYEVSVVGDTMTSFTQLGNGNVSVRSSIHIIIGQNGGGYDLDIIEYDTQPNSTNQMSKSLSSIVNANRALLESIYGAGAILEVWIGPPGIFTLLTPPNLDLNSGIHSGVQITL